MPNECFVIGPIGEPDSATRRHADQLFKHVIEPVVRDNGYVPTRADRLAEPGLITSQIIQHIVEAPLVVADITDHNPNVFYELAMRHSIRRPFVQMIRWDQRIPFDIAATRTIKFNLADLDSVADAKVALDQQVKRFIENDQDLDTPISVAFDLRKLQQSERPGDKLLADILESIRDVKVTLKGMLENWPLGQQLYGTRRKLPEIGPTTVEFDSSFLNEIRARLPVSEVVGRRVKLKRQGKEYAGLSPFNPEKTPSFFVNDQKGFYHCFSSGKHGDVFTFLMETEGLSFPEAVEKLAAEVGLMVVRREHRQDT